MLLWVACCMIMPGSRALAQGPGITVVSDTTDAEDTLATPDSVSVAVNTPVTIDDDLSWWKFFLGDGSVWELAKSIVAGGSMLVIPLVILFGIILLPVILIVLIIVLLMRDRKRARPQSHYAPAESLHGEARVVEEENPEKEKDRLVIHVAVALGLLVFCIAYNWQFGTLLAVIFLCVQGAKLYNLRRAEKRNNKNE